MNWPRTPKPIGMAEAVIPCMVCHGDRPKVRVIALWNYVRRKGLIVGVQDGERLLCGECGAEYSLDFRRGTFQHQGRPTNATASAPHVVERPLPPPVRTRPA
jgi:hypothetical protein